jgi:hydrophobic/amphiphilic exporter-1 (mainly G- bacteria), HAE1 family
MTRFFLRRPMLAAVASIVLFIAGIIALPSLPIAQYPKVAPPQITVSTTYIGANAQAVESAVTTPLEEAINGVEGLRYMTSTSGNDGTSTITVTFNLGRDLDAAQADVQNAVLSATGRLPQIVQQTGVVVAKSSPAIILGVGIQSDGRMSNNELSDFAEHHVIDSLKRIPGVESTVVFGLRRYAMRIWLDPQRLAMEGLTTSDVVAALQDQNQEVAAGAIGSEPTGGKQYQQIQLDASGRLSTPEQFDQIVIKQTPYGGAIRIADVGHAELGAEDYSTAAHWNGRYTIGFGVIQAQNANALDVATKVRQALAQMAPSFPPGVSYVIPFDATLFVRESIKEVVETLAFAILLVVLVIYAFIQDWRMALVPMITIPISLVGTFALMRLFGFSINTLTLFGLTLATGLVVDDAIVVIENIARFVHEKGMAPYPAAVAAMREISGAVVATSLVLLAVFIPVAFFPGSTGQLYKQFAVTIACSITISLFTALTLAPPLAAQLLGDGERPSHAWVFAWINKGITAIRTGYRRLLPLLFQYRTWVVTAFGAALLLTVFTYGTTQTSFIPDEDQGYLIVVLQTAPGTSADYERAVSARIMQQIANAVPEAEGVFAVDGFGFTGNAPNRGVAFIPLKPWSERRGPQHTFSAILARLYPILAMEPDAQVFAFNPPSVQGIGNFGGFQYQVLNQGDLDYGTMTAAVYRLLGAVNTDPHFAGAFTTFRDDTPEFNLGIDRDKAEALGVSFNDVAQTLGVFEGSQYVNDFNYKNNTYRVFVQADAPFRKDLSGLEHMYVRSSAGGYVPLSGLLTPNDTKVPSEITHFNLFRSIEIDGAPRPGVGTGQMIAAMDALAKKTLPPGMSSAWFGLTRDQIEGGNIALIVFALGIVFVFLVLTAQYENVWNPFVILLSVPVALLGALWAIRLRGIPSDVFVQVGLVMLIGLASKNAILIVEFANQLKAGGLSARAAVMQAAQTRLRPILMTSLAFIFGIFPLAVATGAGSASRNSLGTAVLGGMILSTVLNLVFVPIIYVMVESLRERFAPRHAPSAQNAAFAREVVGWVSMGTNGDSEWRPVYNEMTDMPADSSAARMAPAKATGRGPSP